MIERRFATSRIEYRDTSDVNTSSAGTIVGTPVVWGSLSEDLGGFRERVARGSFDKTLRSNADVRALFNHDPNYPLGRISNRTLTLRDDPSGLRMSCVLPDTSFARDLAELVRRGDIAKMSFAFQCESEDWNDEADPDDPSSRIPVRTILAAKLLDVSPVTSPAYQSTSVQLSSVKKSSLDPAPMSISPQDMMRALWPEGLPAEIRSHVLRSVAKNPAAIQRRRRILEFCL